MAADATGQPRHESTRPRHHCAAASVIGVLLMRATGLAAALLGPGGFVIMRQWSF